MAPPDAVAATAIFRRLGVAPRIVTILEGESLINDATALIAYRSAVVAATTVGSFSIAGTGLWFVVAALGGIAIGVLVGLLLTSAWAADLGPDARDRDLAPRPVRGLPAGRGRSG